MNHPYSPIIEDEDVIIFQRNDYSWMVLCTPDNEVFDLIRGQVMDDEETVEYYAKQALELLESNGLTGEVRIVEYFPEIDILLKGER